MTKLNRAFRSGYQRGIEDGRNILYRSEHPYSAEEKEQFLQGYDEGVKRGLRTRSPGEVAESVELPRELPEPVELILNE